MNTNVIIVHTELAKLHNRQCKVGLRNGGAIECNETNQSG